MTTRPLCPPGAATLLPGAPYPAAIHVPEQRRGGLIDRHGPDVCWAADHPRVAGPEPGRGCREPAGPPCPTRPQPLPWPAATTASTNSRSAGRRARWPPWSPPGWSIPRRARAAPPPACRPIAIPPVRRQLGAARGCVGVEHRAPNGSQSPAAAALHPLDPLKALSSGPSSNSGAARSEHHRPGRDLAAPDHAQLWLAGPRRPRLAGPGLSPAATMPSTSACAPRPTTARSSSRAPTTAAPTWAADNTTNIDVPGLADDRQYLWTDKHPTSPFYGRTYLTQANLDPGISGSYDSISVRWTTDEGTTWSPVNALVDSTEFQQHLNHNEFASLAIQPAGAIVAAWHRGKCCGGSPTLNVANKVAWSRSTDGGVTFPISGTVVTVPISQSVSYNSSAPAASAGATPPTSPPTRWTAPSTPSGSSTACPTSIPPPPCISAVAPPTLPPGPRRQS